MSVRLGNGEQAPSEVHSVWVKKGGVRTLQWESYGERFDTLKEAMADAKAIEQGLQSDA